MNYFYSYINALSCNDLIKIKIILLKGKGKIFYKKNLDYSVIISIKYITYIINKNFSNYLKNKNLFFLFERDNIIKKGFCLELPFILGILSFIYNFNINKNVVSTGKLNYKLDINPSLCIRKKIITAYKNNIKYIIISSLSKFNSN